MDTFSSLRAALCGQVKNEEKQRILSIQEKRVLKEEDVQEHFKLSSG